jgi:hypothetical protein
MVAAIALAAPAYADAVDCPAHLDALRAMMASDPHHWAVTSFKMLPPSAGWAGWPCVVLARTVGADWGVTFTEIAGQLHAKIAGAPVCGSTKVETMSCTYVP